MPTLVALTAALGLIVGFELSQILKPNTYQFVGNASNYEADVDAAMVKYEKAKGSGNFLKALTPDEMINVGYRLFSLEESNYTRGVGYTQAAMVRQEIQSTTVKEGSRYFEESNSIGLVNLHDRMYESEGQTTTYWGERDDYANHPKKTMSNGEYEEMMGRTVSTSLVYIVSGATVLSGTTASGDPPTGASDDGTHYIVEAEINPKIGTLRYKKQMQSISSLKYPPTFEWCHITVTLDHDLNLVKMATHEKYTATTSAGVGSSCEGRLVTCYYHEPAPFGFPEVDAKLPEYPSSL